MTASPPKETKSIEDKPKLVQASSPPLDVDTHPLLANLRLDGKEIGAYMLCKFSDDVLGHRARQIFREKASSIKGENGIYYFLKDLFKTFSVDEVPSTNKAKPMFSMMKKAAPKTTSDIYLEEHQFRKLMASDPAFECLVAQEDTSILFQRILNSSSKTKVSLLDFLEFCLLDRVQLLVLLCKYWYSLRKLKLSDNELLEIFRRMTEINHDGQISPSLFGNAIGREFDLVLTTGEIDVLLQMLDYDGDGVVKPPDFEAFYKDTERFQSLKFDELPPITDLKFSTSDEEASELKREGFQMYPRNIWSSHPHGHLYLWYKRDPSKVAIEAIEYARTNQDKSLMARGYVCFNGAKPFYKKYVYIKYATAKPQSVIQTPAIVDICITGGHLLDEQSASLWIPPCRGFKRIDGSLDEKINKRGVYLWTRSVAPVSDIVSYNPASTVASASTTAAIPIEEIDALEHQIRSTVRRRCPTDADGVLNFLKLFQTFDVKNRKYLTMNKIKTGLISLGCRLDVKRFQEVWKRIDVHNTKRIDFDTLLLFVVWTDTEIDAIAETLQRALTSASSNYRLIFTSNNAIGDGKWARSDFLKLLGANQILVTSEELAKIMQRFDVNKDGVVDYADFLKFVTGICDVQARMAARIAHAASVFQGWAIEHQNHKLAKDGCIDSSSSWKLIKSQGDVLRIPMIDKILRQHKLRLSPNELRQLCTIISPSPSGMPSPGQISAAAYHAFVNHNPKKISTLLLAGRKIVGPGPTGDVDPVFNRFNSLGTGNATLPELHKHLTDLALEQNIPSIDIKDFVYLVQHTGADCGGDGSIVIDRFLASVREVAERRNMKHGFITPYDSPNFAKGCYMLIGELKRCAKTLDGKFDFSIPFHLFDTENIGYITPSQFEATIGEMNIGQYLTQNEIKSFLRRFELNAQGGISYEEFCRFATTNDQSHHLLSSWNDPKLVSAMKEAFATQLPAYGAETFANDKPYLIEALAHHANSADAIPYDTFCEVYLACMQSPTQEKHEVNSVLALELFTELQKAQTKANHRFDFKEACELYGHKLSGSDFKEMLWMAGLRYPFAPEELSALHSYFLSPSTQQWDTNLFCDFAVRGPKVFESGESRGKVDAVIAQIQQNILDIVKNEKDADKFHKLFLEYDTNQDGSISTDEFLLVLDAMGLSKGLTVAEKTSILHFFDSNQDNAIDYQEFFHFAENADKILQSKVDPTKEPPKPAASPEKEKPKSPTKEVPPSPTKDQIQALQHQGQFTRLGRQLVLLALLDKQLPRPFVFGKYFLKYKSNGDGVIASKFGQILDKFLDTVLHANKHANVATIDVNLIRDHYLVHETGLVKTSIFLKEFATAQMLALDSKVVAQLSQDDSDQEEDISLSGSSSDSDNSSICQKKQVSLDIVLDRVLLNANWSSDKYGKCEKKLLEHEATTRLRLKTFLHWLVSLKLPWKKSDLDAIAVSCKIHRNYVDPSRFVNEMNAAIARASGMPTSRSLSPAKETTSIRTLMTKLYQSFLAAAQRNINGLHLLEKCDVHSRGMIEWREFSTVLTILECPISPSELNVLQNALQSKNHCPYRAFGTLLETYATPPETQRNVYQPHPPVTFTSTPMPAFGGRTIMTPAANLNPQALENELQKYFQSDQIDRSRFLALCQKYDGQRTGFVTLDGFYAVLRQLGIYAPPNVCTQVSARFSATFSDTIDYIEFGQVVLADPTPRSRNMPLLTQNGAPLRREDAPVLTARTVETWLKEAATEEEKSHFNQMYNSIFEYKKHTKTPDARFTPRTQQRKEASPALWNCPVCFHSQSMTFDACEICASKNIHRESTKSNEFEVIIQCPICAFRNKPSASACSLCQTPLTATKTETTRPAQALHISNANDGWLT